MHPLVASNFSTESPRQGEGCRLRGSRGRFCHSQGVPARPGSRPTLWVDQRALAVAALRAPRRARFLPAGRPTFRRARFFPAGRPTFRRAGPAPRAAPAWYFVPLRWPVVRTDLSARSCTIAGRRFSLDTFSAPPISPAPCPGLARTCASTRCANPLSTAADDGRPRRLPRRGAFRALDGAEPSVPSAICTESSAARLINPDSSLAMAWMRERMSASRLLLGMIVSNRDGVQMHWGSIRPGRYQARGKRVVGNSPSEWRFAAPRPGILARLHR